MILEKEKLLKIINNKIHLNEKKIKEIRRVLIECVEYNTVKLENKLNGALDELYFFRDLVEKL